MSAISGYVPSWLSRAYTLAHKEYFRNQLRYANCVMLLAYVRGVVADGKRGLGGNVLALGCVILGGHGQLLQAHQHLAVGAADDVAVHDIHVVYRLTGQRGESAAQAVFFPSTRSAKQAALYILRPRGDGSSFETGQGVHWFSDVVSGYVHRWLEVHT